MEYIGYSFTSLPFRTSTFAKRAIKTNLGIPPLPGSAIGLSDSRMSFNSQMDYKWTVFNNFPRREISKSYS